MPKITVVIPIKGHPGLVNDALFSAQREAKSGAISRIIVIDDGCSFEQTRSVLGAWQAELGALLQVEHWRNGGLSAARNRGIAAAFAADPDLDGIFLLDADNTLAEGAGARMVRLLQESPEADWFYPRFDFFGQNGHYISDAAPSLLFQSVVNAMEAGSLVRARVFARGLRFDETMRGGYEDWDFWLSAQSAGFKGQLVQAPFLNYRKRPVSMLSGSHERDAELRAYLQKKHKWLYQVPKLLALEAAEFPRYALFAAEEEAVLLCTDPRTPQKLSWQAFSRSLFAALLEPYANPAPQYLVFTRAGLLEDLSRAKLLHHFFWSLERRQTRQPKVLDCFHLIEEKTGLAVHPQLAPAGQEPDAIVLSLSQLRRLLDGDLAAFVRDLDSHTPTIEMSHWGIGLPNLQPRAQTAQRASEVLRNTLLRLQRSPFLDALQTPVEWRLPGGAHKRQDAYQIPRSLCGGGVVLPYLKGDDGKDVAFVLPIVSFGGVEKVAASLARALKKDGWRCHLVVVGVTQISCAPWMLEAFETLHWQPDETALSWGGPEYLGTNESSWGSAAQKADLVGLLAGMDMVINAHCAALHQVADVLRRQGVILVDHEHLLERSQTGRAYGPPVLALAYETAYDKILTCSKQLAAWFAGEGVPEEKVMPLLNAAGYPIEEEALFEALERRMEASEEPLRVAYLGRFDPQKGIDRLLRVYQILAQIAPQIELSAVGGGVVGALDEFNFGPSVKVLPALRDPEALTAQLLQTDVLLLPSYFEGVPLVVLEAQRLGVVVIATDVGALNEAIDHGKTGYLVPSEGCEEAMVELVLQLERSPAQRRSIWETAIDQSRSWEESSAAFRAWAQNTLTTRRKGVG